MSIKSLKRYKDAPVALYTDVDYNSSFDGLVDIHRKISPKHIRAKVRVLRVVVRIFSGQRGLLRHIGRLSKY